MIEGEFRLPQPFSSSANPYQHRDRIRYKLADLYIVKVDVEINVYVAIKPGNKVLLKKALKTLEVHFFSYLNVNSSKEQLVAIFSNLQNTVMLKNMLLSEFFDAKKFLWKKISTHR